MLEANKSSFVFFTFIYFSATPCLIFEKQSKSIHSKSTLVIVVALNLMISVVFESLCRLGHEINLTKAWNEQKWKKKFFVMPTVWRWATFGPLWKYFEGYGKIQHGKRWWGLNGFESNWLTYVFSKVWTVTGFKSLRSNLSSFE